MPRPKVLEGQRRRIAKACLACQKSKQKCDGARPCNTCAIRSRQDTCAYSAHERSYGQYRTRKPRRVPHREDAGEDQSCSENAHLADGTPAPTRSQGSQNDGSSRPKLNTVTQASASGEKTKIYLGEGGTISTLRHLGALVDIYDEVSAAALEGYESNEAVPIQTTQSEAAVVPETDAGTLLELIDVFLISTRGSLDITDHSTLEDLTSRHCEGTLPETDPETAFYFLVLACAAIFRSSDPDDLTLAEQFFERGNRIAHSRMRYEPTLHSAKFFLLVYKYLLARCQRNAAFFNLGVAISAAKTIGIHRNAFDSKATHSRWGARVWTTLRYHDMYFCAMNGRTPSSITTDAYGWPKNISARRGADRQWTQQQEDMMQSTNAFSFMEQCLLRGPQTLALDDLRGLAQQLRDAGSTYPMIGERQNPCSRLEMTGRTAVACNYYFSMMVLTRPLLIACVRSKRNYRSCTGAQHDADSNSSADCMAGSMASIDAATYTIDTVHQGMAAKILYHNMSWVVGWVFLAALVLSLAHLGQLGIDWEIVQGIEKAKEILGYFHRTSQQADQYRRIITRVSEAVEQALHRFAERERGAHSLSLPNFLGNAFIEVIEVGTRDSRQVSRPDSPSGQYSEIDPVPQPENNDGAGGGETRNLAMLGETTDWSDLDWAMEDIFNLTAFFDDTSDTQIASLDTPFPSTVRVTNS